MVGEADVLAVIDRFWAGWEGLDAGAVLATIADRPEAVVIGTDNPEYWVGRDAMAGPFRAMTTAFESEHVRWSPGDPRLEVRDDAAWAVGRLLVTVEAAGVRTESVMRATFILVRDRGSWAIVHAHFSVPAREPVVGY